jgi:predicted MPP superfamily phosphohydrolase
MGQAPDPSATADGTDNILAPAVSRPGKPNLVPPWTVIIIMRAEVFSRYSQLMLISQADNTGGVGELYRLRILHISDLHERGTREPEPWRRERVLGEAWERVLPEFLQDGPIDLICFTGDIADWGLPEEYTAATSFFDSLCRSLGVQRERLFVIPGNHDVHRKTSEAAWNGLRSLVHKVDGLAMSRWIAGQSDPPPGVSKEWREQVFTRQAAYRQWTKDLGRAELAVDLGYRSTLTIDGRPFPVHVIGVNTAWLCGDDFDARNLMLADAQLMSVATEKGQPLPGFRLMLMHHPFEDLKDGADCRRLITGHVDLVLRGHLHEPEPDGWADPARGARLFAAGCLYEGDRADYYRNSCQVLTLELGEKGDLLGVQPRFWSWSRRGRWYDDRSVDQDISPGVSNAPIPPPARRLRTNVPATRDRNPYDPWTPRPEMFVGRREVLQWLYRAATDGRSVSILGDSAIGKSILLSIWQTMLVQEGRTVVHLSGENLTGSRSAIVEAITGAPSSDDPDQAADLVRQWAGSVASTGGVPVLLLDEAEAALPILEVRFLERLRGMGSRIALGFASRIGLDEIPVRGTQGSPWSNRFETVRLGLLEEDAARELIEIGAARHLQTILRWAGRHPFFIQLLAYYLIEAERNGLSLSTAEERFLIQADKKLKEIWRALQPQDRDGLNRLRNQETVDRFWLRHRGLLTEEGRPFGEVLTFWLRNRV